METEQSRRSSWKTPLLKLIPPERLILKRIKHLLFSCPTNKNQLLQFIKRVTAYRLIKPNTRNGLVTNELAVIIRNQLYFFGFHELRNMCLSLKIPVMEVHMFNQEIDRIINLPDFSVQQISSDCFIYDGIDYTVTDNQPSANFYAFYVPNNVLHLDSLMYIPYSDDMLYPDRNYTSYHIIRLRTVKKTSGYILQYHQYLRLFPKTQYPVIATLDRPETKSISCLWAQKKIRKYGWKDLLDYCYRKNRPEKILVCKTTPKNFTMFMSLHKYFPTCLIKMIDLFLGDDISPFQLPDYFEKTQ
jgi:hypothetical protein